MVRGDIDASITTTFMLRYADIVAASINKGITLGWGMKGAIVALGSEDGTSPGYIESVSAGFGTPDHPTFNQEEEAAYTGTNGVDKGMTGLWFPPFDPTEYDDWFNAAGQDSGGTVAGGGAIDGLVKATGSIGAVDIANMTLRTKQYVPRIESPSIGHLRIDHIKDGVVWSGKLQTPTNDPADDYAQITDLSIGCLSPVADVWFEGDYGANIDGDVLGDLHLRHLPAGATVQIGGRLGDHSDFCSSCGSAYGGCESEDNLAEDSPRDVIDSGDPDYGRILLRDDYSLSGQIIINSDAELTPGDGWEGLVQIGEESPISLQPGNLDPRYDAPYYTALSSELGGGAVGLVPFELHGADCIPSVGIDGVPEFLNSAWIAGPGNPGVNEIRLRHYGPVFAGAQPLVIELLPTPTQADPDPDPVDLTDQFTIQLAAQDSTLGPREVRISQNGMRPIGLFRVTPLQLYCADTTAADAPGVYPYTYLFRMLSDCNNRNGDDALELSPTTDADGDGILDECQTGACDCNLAPPINPGDPGADVDVGDLLAYLDLWFAVDPAAERTGDSTVNVFDLLDYLDCWFPHNGGVC